MNIVSAGHTKFLMIQTCCWKLEEGHKCWKLREKYDSALWETTTCQYSLESAPRNAGGQWTLRQCLCLVVILFVCLFFQKELRSGKACVNTSISWGQYGRLKLYKNGLNQSSSAGTFDLSPQESHGPLGGVLNIKIFSSLAWCLHVIEIPKLLSFILEIWAVIRMDQ